MQRTARTLAFIGKCIVIGLALAFVLVWARPRLLGDRLQPVVEITRAAPNGQLPVSAGAPDSYAVAVNRAADAVVNIHAAKIVERSNNPYLDNPLMRRFFDAPAVPRHILKRTLGSGVIFSDDGYIVTNHHVIDGAEQIQVALSDGRVEPARIVGVDPETDLAVLKVDAGNLPAITIGSSRALDVGDIVLAIGNPYGFGQTVTMGIVSATGRSELNVATYENFIQTDAAINRGNSGGALINTRGQLVGINTAVLNHASGAQGISFAIPVAIVTEVFTDIVEYGYVIRGWLGISVPTLPQGAARPGVPVAAVQRGGPAARAGIRPGDVLLSLNGRALRSAQRLQAHVASLKPGTPVDVVVARDGQRFKTKVVLGQRPVGEE